MQDVFHSPAARCSASYMVCSTSRAKPRRLKFERKIQIDSVSSMRDDGDGGSIDGKRTHDRTRAKPHGDGWRRAVAGGARARSALRWTLRLCRSLDGHLLPPFLPGAPA